ncbi:MAG: hypothetical protein M3O09_14755 [Acidobacteriota bacterium]|nr:hypothetical protein [Acidobacteriota bacterium]
MPICTSAEVRIENYLISIHQEFIPGLLFHFTNKIKKIEPERAKCLKLRKGATASEMSHSSYQRTIREMEAEISKEEKQARAEIADPVTHDLGLARMDLVMAHRKILEIVKARHALPCDPGGSTT